MKLEGWRWGVGVGGWGRGAADRREGALREREEAGGRWDHR